MWRLRISWQWPISAEACCKQKFLLYTCIMIKKVKWSCYTLGVAQGLGRVIALVFITAALEGGEWSAARVGRTLPSRKTRYPFYGRLGGPQGRSGRAEYLFSTGIRSRTIQPVVSRYTDWATRPMCLCVCVCVYIHTHTHTHTKAFSVVFGGVFIYYLLLLLLLSSSSSSS